MITGCLAATIGAVASFGAFADEAPLPIADKDSHMGVFSCSGSTCHGAVQPWQNANVLQNEFVTWQRKDKHAKAYQVLLDERSKRIARNLGLKSAHTAKICLDCHADNVSQARRHQTFQMTDGVSCEACHGGAGRWIGTHIMANASHQKNIENGLYPTAEPVSRARLCLSCHFGDDSRPMTHRIMGAGHPRISFELDTFTAIQPAHFTVDADYRKRKGDWNGVQLWAIGQVTAIISLLDQVLDSKRNRNGVFPELVVFDCHSCHRPMSGLKWERRATVGLPPGMVRINDSNLLMMQIIAGRVDSDLAAGLRSRTLALHKATAKSFDKLLEQAKALREIAVRLRTRFATHKFGQDDMRALLSGVLKFGFKGEFVDYPGAEQATMALGAIINAMKNTGSITEDQFGVMNKALKGVLAAVDKDEAYVHKTFVAALKAFGRTVPR
ncbi:MAG: multiheme c-type cytochrome [Rhodospirillales bacterium]